MEDNPLPMTVEQSGKPETNADRVDEPLSDGGPELLVLEYSDVADEEDENQIALQEKGMEDAWISTAEGNFVDLLEVQ